MKKPEKFIDRYIHYDIIIKHAFSGRCFECDDRGGARHGSTEKKNQQGAAR